MKVAFLDIDGVLVTRESFEEPSGNVGQGGAGERARKSCVEALNYVLKETKAKIVVSSSWRAPRRLGWLRDTFTEWGIHAAQSRTIGMTPMLHRQAAGVSMEFERGDEIQAWLDEHPEVESFVILDDDDDMKHLKHRLVQSTFEKGLTMELAKKAVDMLA